MNSGDTKLTRKTDVANEVLGKSISFLDGMFGSVSQEA